MGAETDRDSAPAQDRLPNGSSPDGPPLGATGIPSQDTDTEPPNGSPSVLDLIVAYRRKDRGRYQKLKDEFVEDNGTVQDEYIAVKTQSAAYLTAKRGSVLRWRHSYRIRAYYARALDPRTRRRGQEDPLRGESSGVPFSAAVPRRSSSRSCSR